MGPGDLPAGHDDHDASAFLIGSRSAAAWKPSTSPAASTSTRTDSPDELSAETIELGCPRRSVRLCRPCAGRWWFAFRGMPRGGGCGFTWNGCVSPRRSSSTSLDLWWAWLERTVPAAPCPVPSPSRAGWVHPEVLQDGGERGWRCAPAVGSRWERTPGVTGPCPGREGASCALGPPRGWPSVACWRGVPPLGGRVPVPGAADPVRAGTGSRRGTRARFATAPSLGSTGAATGFAPATRDRSLQPQGFG